MAAVAKNQAKDQVHDMALDLLAERLSVSGARYANPPHLTVHQVGVLLAKSLAALFPHFRGGAVRPSADQLMDLGATAREMLVQVMPDSGAVEDQVQHFMQGLPDIAEKAHIDAKALLAFDPAARSLNEIILSYPGLRAIIAYRIAHRMLGSGVALLPRLITEFAHRKTGIEIHPGAQIGDAFCIDHGTGIVIGETTIIGHNVKLFQGVTLGGLSVKKEIQGQKRHPSLEDNVTVYSGATVLGGDTVVGHNSIIGGNVWLTKSVPPWSRVMFKPCDTEIVDPAARGKDAEITGLFGEGI